MEAQRKFKYSITIIPPEGVLDWQEWHNKVTANLLDAMPKGAILWMASERDCVEVKEVTERKLQ